MGQYKTVAYEAEQEIKKLLYTDTGIYKPYQFKNASARPIDISTSDLLPLWNTEASYRPYFEIEKVKKVVMVDGIEEEIEEELVHIPTINLQVIGVKDGKYKEYLKLIKQLDTENVIKLTTMDFSYLIAEIMDDQYDTRVSQDRSTLNLIKMYYPNLRPCIQQRMSDALDELIVSKNVNLSSDKQRYVALHLPKRIIDGLNNWDFTKQVPKLLLVDNLSSLYDREQSVFVNYLQLIGFDVVLISPDGSNALGNFLREPILIEGIMGELVKDIWKTDKRRDNLSVWLLISVIVILSLCFIVILIKLAPRILFVLVCSLLVIGPLVELED